MKRLFVIMAAVLTLSPASARAADEKAPLPKGISELPPGMEVIKVGTANIIAPEGSKVYEENTVMIVEPIEQYAARRFMDQETRIIALEEEVKSLTAAVEALKKQP